MRGSTVTVRDLGFAALKFLGLFSQRFVEHERPARDCQEPGYGDPRVAGQSDPPMFGYGDPCMFGLSDPPMCGLK